MKQKIKIIFFGSDSFSVPILKALIKEFDVILVVTKSDQKAGRGNVQTANPLKKFAQSQKLNLIVVERLNDKNIKEINSAEADIYIVAAFGLMIPKSLLKSPSGISTINVHPSLLPNYRGPSPIESAILAGEKKTGVSIMVLDEKMDHGPIIAQKKEAISEEDDFITLSERLENISNELLTNIIPDFIDGKIKPKPQNESQATYCQIIKKGDGKIDFKQNADQILQQIRAYIHWPGSFANWKEKGKIIKIIGAHLQNTLPEPPYTAGMVYKTSDGKPSVICGNGAISLDIIQIEGKKPTDSASFLNGRPDFIGSNLD